MADEHGTLQESKPIKQEVKMKVDVKKEEVSSEVRKGKGAPTVASTANPSSSSPAARDEVKSEGAFSGPVDREPLVLIPRRARGSVVAGVAGPPSSPFDWAPPLAGGRRPTCPRSPTWRGSCSFGRACGIAAASPESSFARPRAACSFRASAVARSMESLHVVR